MNRSGTHAGGAFIGAPDFFADGCAVGPLGIGVGVDDAAPELDPEPHAAVFGILDIGVGTEDDAPEPELPEPCAAMFGAVNTAPDKYNMDQI